MEPNSVQFLENKTILVTGASGFLAKVLLERILRLQPNLKRHYILVSASDKKSAEQRLRSEIFEKDLFKVLRKNVGDKSLNVLISEKVVPVLGDVSLNNIGVNDSILLQDMMQEIDFVCHSAGTTRFDERSGLIEEKPFAMGEILNGKNKVDINTEMRLVEQKMKQLIEQGCSEEETKQAMRDLGLKRAKLYGWPNTYVFTKSMGEMFLGHYRENMPIVIIRPTIITSTISDPFPGWIEGFKTVDSILISYGKGSLKCFLVDHKAVCDIIPVDMVVNAMIATAAEHSGDFGSHTVYHVGSSYRNPVKYNQIYKTMIRYFVESPLLCRNGKPIIVPNVTTLSTMAKFRVYTSLRYKLPIQILRLLSVICPSQLGDKYEHHNRIFKKAMRLVKLYKPYVLFKGIFDDRNLETLRIKNIEAKEMNKLFGSNPKCIDWEGYLMNTHIHGLITHVLKK